MNIQTQCCGMIVLLVLFLFYRQQEKVNLNTEKAYGRAFVVTLVSISMDILSVIAIVNMDKLSVWLVKFICKTYLVSMIGVALSSLLYIYADLYSKDGKYRKFIKKYIVFAGICAIVIYALPIYIHCDVQGGNIYTYGPGAMATYGFALSVVIINTYSVIRHKNRINARRREAVFIWMAVWVSAAIIQFIDKSILIIGYAFAIGIMVLYLKLENPEQNLDKRTGLFNQNAFAEYTRQLHGEGNSFSVLCLYFENAFHQNSKRDMMEDVNMEVSRYLAHIPRSHAFKNAEDEIVLLFGDLNYAQDIIKLLRVRFNAGWGKEGSVMLRPHEIFIPDLQMVSGAKDIFYLLRYIRENSRNYTDNNFITVNSSMVVDMYEEKETEQLILDAIEKDRIEVFYQPIYSTEEKCFSSAEALVRMRDEEGTLIPPGEFISVAEKNGLIITLGEVVFEKVCRFLKEQDITRYGLHYIEVNLSVIQCAYPNLGDDYIQIMREYGIEPSQINLEITESASLTAKATLLDNMGQLMEQGVQFSLDDFGTGQSNLNYIVDMPVEIVKFDRDMTNAYFENGKAKYVMDAAMHMIHGLNLQIVSEGIETKEQFEAMESLGIKYIQGYYFSRPLPEGEFLEFIKKENER